MKTRIMYIESKGEGITGSGRIGRVTFSKSGKSIYYKGRMYQSLKGRGFKANYIDSETGEEYWISGCKKDGNDHLYSGTTEIDDDVREEYWSEIRKVPGKRNQGTIRDMGKHPR